MKNDTLHKYFDGYFSIHPLLTTDPSDQRWRIAAEQRLGHPVPQALVEILQQAVSTQRLLQRWANRAVILAKDQPSVGLGDRLLLAAFLARNPIAVELLVTYGYAAIPPSLRDDMGHIGQGSSGAHDPVSVLPDELVRTMMDQPDIELWKALFTVGDLDDAEDLQRLAHPLIWSDFMNGTQAGAPLRRLAQLDAQELATCAATGSLAPIWDGLPTELADRAVSKVFRIIKDMPFSDARPVCLQLAKDSSSLPFVDERAIGMSPRRRAAYTCLFVGNSASIRERGGFAIELVVSATSDDFAASIAFYSRGGAKHGFELLDNDRIRLGEKFYDHRAPRVFAAGLQRVLGAPAEFDAPLNLLFQLAESPGGADLRRWIAQEVADPATAALLLRHLQPAFNAFIPNALENLRALLGAEAEKVIQRSLGKSPTQYWQEPRRE